MYSVRRISVVKTRESVGARFRVSLCLFKELQRKAAEVGQWRSLSWDVTGSAVAFRIRCVNTCRMGRNCWLEDLLRGSFINPLDR